MFSFRATKSFHVNVPSSVPVAVIAGFGPTGREDGMAVGWPGPDSRVDADRRAQVALHAEQPGEASPACHKIRYVVFDVAFKYANPSASRPNPRRSRRPPPRGQVCPRDQGRPRSRRQAHPERRTQGHAAGRMDAPPDGGAAQQFWLKITGTRSSQFRSPTLKHHNPKTRRTNVGENYRGCLRIDVRRSAVLYRKIEGWAAAAMTGQTLSAAWSRSVSLALSRSPRLAVRLRWAALSPA